MKLLPVIGFVLFVTLSFAATHDYTITILRPETSVVIPRPEYQPSAKLVGKSIADLFGSLSEIRVESDVLNAIGIEGDAKKLEQRIRERIGRAKCLGRESEVAWHLAPWIHGYVLFKDGRILPIKILLSGIIIGDLLFAERA